jgi:hypothetical protein
VYGRQIAIPAAFLLLTAAGFGFLFFRDQRDIASDVMVLSTVTLALSVALLVALNRGFGAPFPFSRTGLYLIPLFTLSLLTAGGVLMRRSFRYGGHAVAGVLAAASLLYIGQWNTRYFSVWRFDAATNRLADTIAADRKGRELEPFTVASSKLYGETLKYYRKRRRLHAMAPDIPVADLEKTSADYYVLTPGERDLIGKLHLRVLLEDEFSGGIVARKS